MPISPLTIPKDPVDFPKLADLNLGDLTGLGQHQCNQLGDVIYDRYIDVNSKTKIKGIVPHYESKQYSFRSTDLDRTLMSMWSISMGLFKEGTGRRAIVNYKDAHDMGREVFALPNGTQAVPIHTVSEDMDSLLLGFSFCNTVLNRMSIIRSSKGYIDFFKKHRVVIDKLYNETGWKAQPNDGNIGVLFDLLTVQRSHDLLSIRWVNENWEVIDSIRNNFLLMIYNYNVIGKEGSSELIKTLKSNMDSTTKYKYIHYSAHDTTLQSLAASLKLTNDYPFLGYQPNYGAWLALELHEMTDGTAAVRIVHGKQYNDTSTPLKLTSLGCNTEFCPLTEFEKHITRDSIVTNWCRACDNSQRNICASEYLKSSEESYIAFLVSTPTLAFTNAITLIALVFACARSRRQKYKEMD
ncbi:predicted protein [Naegleria gruberi]|uniref:Predicted protein n=1 Tax=Naegleria gruberi TaxID=5762 RepID=D2V3Z9_NAEGR|nr:uncharacterized protein NAEGRDRAFT_63547 [Naegleria gruberi]EFC48290.1 predicted protein [Naegleria gruberi]|eukprot:XP_002681034.1 predicted protein [Naegleria gruberi strain NEG-M]